MTCNCGCNDPPEERDPPENAGPKTTTTALTLEQIVELTDEMEHLNELVMLHLDKAGGYKSPTDYFSTVTPILDLLEVEIRVRCSHGTTRDEMKRIVMDWIDDEMRRVLRGNRDLQST